MRISMLLLVSVMLAGCGTWPQNAQEFRDRAKAGPHKDLVESVEVSRPLADVSATLRKQSAACLNIKVTLKTCSGGVNSSGVRTGGCIVHEAGAAFYKTTFVANGNHAEVDVRRKLEGAREIDLGAPEDGAYRLVVDATAVSANRTRVDIYRMFYNDHTDEAIRDAFIHWAKGDSLGCPVLNK